MVLKYYKTKKAAYKQKKKVGTPGIAMRRTSLIWRKGDKRRKNKVWVMRY